MTTTAELVAPASESYGRLFLQFPRFGFVAWGGPVVQIPMIRHELVDEEYQASSERFSPTLALYRAPIQGSWRIDMTLSA